MPKDLKRIYGQGHLHFIAFSCYHRLPLLHSARARSAFIQVLDQVGKEYAFKSVGYVVMPEHVHLLISEPARAIPSTALKMLKQCVSRRLRQRSRLSAPAAQGSFEFAPANEQLPQFWQRRFHDFNV